MLMGGDRRSIGLADEVADLVGRQSKHVFHLIECLWDPDALLRMRAADAAEKLSRDKAVYLQPYREPLLGLLAEARKRKCDGISRMTAVPSSGHSPCRVLPI